MGLTGYGIYNLQVGETMGLTGYGICNIQVGETIGTTGYGIYNDWETKESRSKSEILDILPKVSKTIIYF